MTFSLPPICLSLSLCRSCHGFMHMKFSQSRDGKFILGENSPPFDSIPEVIHYYTTNKLPIRGAEHLSLLFPVLVQTLWDHTHTHTLITHTDTLRASLRRLLQCFIFNHISQALREFDLCLEWELDFSGVWSDSSLVWMKTQSACTDTVLMCYTRVKNIFHTTGL